ncbi:hypothetical protein N7478_003904 [Penicillium angulare]|uniref:uncharacterized protein n=1 Tax=Penicillium angulare TaxID=116970 RepID=UPI00253FFFCD|nr:uncharacterized protein N7478_003904 [Penicillium angulare]KAJ5288218.1 hypothetical protein N7478_003904 [Penicillium angulare]
MSNFFNRLTNFLDERNRDPRRRIEFIAARVIARMSRITGNTRWSDDYDWANTYAMLYYRRITQTARIRSKEIPDRPTAQGGCLSDGPTDQNGLWEMPNVPNLTRWRVEYGERNGVLEARIGHEIIASDYAAAGPDPEVDPDFVSTLIALYHRTQGTTNSLRYFFSGSIRNEQTQRLQRLMDLGGGSFTVHRTHFYFEDFMRTEIGRFVRAIIHHAYPRGTHWVSQVVCAENLNAPGHWDIRFDIEAF